MPSRVNSSSCVIPQVFCGRVRIQVNLHVANNSIQVLVCHHPMHVCLPTCTIACLDLPVKVRTLDSQHRGISSFAPVVWLLNLCAPGFREIFAQAESIPKRVCRECTRGKSHPRRTFLSEEFLREAIRLRRPTDQFLISSGNHQIPSKQLNSPGCNGTYRVSEKVGYHGHDFVKWREEVEWLPQPRVAEVKRQKTLSF